MQLNLHKKNCLHFANFATVAHFAVALCVATTIFASCKKNEQTQNVQQQEQSAKTSYAVNVYNISKGNLDGYLEFGGDVIAQKSVDIMPEMSGKLVKCTISVGDTVKKNSIIGYVDPSRPGMDYVASPIKAPISGTVVSQPVPVGSMVSQSTSIGKISVTDTLEIHMDVAERFVSRIAEGQTAYLAFDAYPDEQFSAKVVELSPVIDSSTRTMGVKLRVSPFDSRIKAGMYARIKLITDAKKGVIVVPYSAVVTRFGETVCFVVQNGVAQKRNVTCGLRVDDKIEITDGLSEGEAVVIKGQTLLDDGALVSVVASQNGEL